MATARRSQIRPVSTLTPPQFHRYPSHHGRQHQRPLPPTRRTPISHPSVSSRRHSRTRPQPRVADLADEDSSSSSSTHSVREALELVDFAVDADDEHGQAHSRFSNAPSTPRPRRPSRLAKPKSFLDAVNLHVEPNHPEARKLRNLTLTQISAGEAYRKTPCRKKQPPATRPNPSDIHRTSNPLCASTNLCDDDVEQRVEPLPSASCSDTNNRREPNKDSELDQINSLESPTQEPSSQDTAAFMNDDPRMNDPPLHRYRRYRDVVQLPGYRTSSTGARRSERQPSGNRESASDQNKPPLNLSNNITPHHMEQTEVIDLCSSSDSEDDQPLINVILSYRQSRNTMTKPSRKKSMLKSSYWQNGNRPRPNNGKVQESRNVRKDMESEEPPKTTSENVKPPKAGQNMEQVMKMNIVKSGENSGSETSVMVTGTAKRKRTQCVRAPRRQDSRRTEEGRISKTVGLVGLGTNRSSSKVSKQQSTRSPLPWEGDRGAPFGWPDRGEGPRIPRSVLLQTAPGFGS